jgi:membrane-bound lytic murein transglycosylase B
MWAPAVAVVLVIVLHAAAPAALQNAAPAPAPQAAQAIPPVPPLPLPPFDVWLGELRAEAEARGIRPDVIDKALGGVEPVAQILERDRAQAEFTYTLDAYLRRRLPPRTVRTAREMYRRHRGLVERIGKAYGVDPRLLISVWGLESEFGRFAGVRPTFPTLATLAYDPRRGAMFRNELMNALEIVNRGDIELARLKGSWAGALGQPQFMPSSYLRYAQDFDGDGRRDIWTSQPDVFASIAYYLQQHGWEKGRLWGREVSVPPSAAAELAALPLRTEGCRARREMSIAQPLNAWHKLGLRTAARQPLPASTTVMASLIRDQSRAFLVYANYEALLDYNCAHSYALSVALLADRL